MHNGHSSTLPNGASPAVSLVTRSSGARHRQRVSVVIPTNGHDPDVTAVLDRMPAIVDDVVLVDSASSTEHSDKAAALRAAFHAARGDCVVMIDTHAGAESARIETFVAALRGGASW